MITITSIFFKQTTVFYILYFFWWTELIRLVIDTLFSKNNPNAITSNQQKTGLMSGLFIMSVYWVFLVAFFGFIAASKNTDIIVINMGVLLFQNWFFNLNLIFILLERLYKHKTHQSVSVYFGAFTPNMIVLHISIIVGGVIMFFLVNKYPNTFTPQNIWGSVLILLPFLFLKGFIDYFSSKKYD